MVTIASIPGNHFLPYKHCHFQHAAIFGANARFQFIAGYGHDGMLENISNIIPHRHRG